MIDSTLITVFTPTFNRGYNFLQLYESLLGQTYKNFEWVIVDDGSTDETKDLVSKLLANNIITINYYWQTNKGKHFAINKGLEIAKGELFFILDSDDQLPHFALETVVEKYTEVKDNPLICGVAGRGMYKSGEIVGNGNFSELIADSLEIRYKHNVTGDLSEVFRTAVLRDYLFPQIENEKFCPEALVWNRISQRYKLLFFNIPIYTIEYMEDGLSSKIVSIRMNSPQASMLTYSELASYDVPILQKIKAAINFWRFAFCAVKPFRTKIAMIPLYLTILTLPIGWVMHLRDKTNS